MAFYAGRMVLEPAMANPTIVVLTDRNDLDDQLFATSSRCRDLLRQDPVLGPRRHTLALPIVGWLDASELTLHGGPS